ncbi:zinc-dependent metalloprotease family protein [Alloprevotella sp. oral taxon 473]|uniref:zinc-dependent metalloprotease family protein n=1 Tax=Alloprevotella sp. oral taxon 473 TaxID=712469 RepID=UPI0018DD75F3|nr:zinc-dependent metalloprotease family protein [Alloprevotella sp. oral taxon 473]
MKSLQSFFSKHHSYAVVKQKLSFLFLLCTLILSPTIGAVEKVHATSFYHSLPSSWRTASTQAQTSVPIIDYFVVYDPSGKAVATQRGGMAKYAQEVVESINAVLRNSHVEGRFRLAGYMEIAEKAQSINQGLGLVSAHAEVRRQRDAAKADLVVLLSEPVNDGASGLATQEAKSIDAGFSSVRASMAAVNYTAAHEAAHNIGCQHSRQQVDAGKHEYAVGASRPEYRTVMAGPHDHVGGQVPIFSGPKSVWKGVVLGSATEDNVRMLRERMPIVAQFSEGNTQISFAPAEWRPDHRAQTLEVKMTTTATYLVTSDAAWLTTDLKSGYNSKTFRLSVADNPQKESRVGHLRFELIGDDESTFVNYTVVQQGTELSSDQPEPKPDPKPVDPVKPDPKPVDPVKPDPKPVNPVKPDPKPVDPVKPEPKPVDPVKPDPKPVEPAKPDPKPVEPTKPDPKPVDPIKPNPKPVEPVNPPKVEEKWRISPNDIHVSAKDTIVVLTIDAPAEFSLQTSAMWFSSTLWQGQGKTKIQLIVEPNEEDKPRNAVLDCHFYLPQSDRKVVEHVKILQDAPIKSGVAGVSTATSFNYSCGWEGDILHVAAPEGAKVEVISLEGRELQQTVIKQTSCSFRIPRGQSSLLIRITAKGRAVVQKVSPAN